MTWVVAFPAGMWSFLVADTRISRGLEPIQGVGVRKVFHVDSRVGVGYAGDVQLGFQLVEQLAAAGKAGDFSEDSLSAAEIADRMCAVVDAGYGGRLPQGQLLAPRTTYLLVVCTAYEPVDNGERIGMGSQFVLKVSDGRKTRLKPPALFPEAIGSGADVHSGFIAELPTFPWDAFDMQMAVDLAGKLLGEQLEASPHFSIGGDLYLVYQMVRAVVVGSSYQIIPGQMLMERTGEPVASSWAELQTRLYEMGDASRAGATKRLLA